MKKKLTSLALVGAFLGLSWYGNVQAQESSGNKIHFINVQEGGSDAIILESNGHFAMVDTGEDYDFPDGSVILAIHGEKELKRLISMF
ncbi:choline binding protein E CbpE [Streptococcus pneumoniae]|nr:choline binding protein E CbpE [Streptococcus pneumoniae]